MTDPATSAEGRLARLLERLLNAAEGSLAAGDLELARAMAEEVRAVDPDNRRAALILQRVTTRQLGHSGERALMTLLFSDMVGSTMLSERVEPEQLRDLFSFYRSAAREAVERYRGQVMQYSGDGIIAGFGYPEPHEDDARRAVLAALDLVVAMRDARADLDRRLGVAPEIRVGIHTGRVVVTDLSNDRSVAERDSIVGLVPNVAARIQQAAEPGMVVISDVTQQLVDADFYMHSLGERELRGIGRPIEIFAVERPRYAGARFEADRYRKAGLVGRDEPRDQMLRAWDTIREGALPVASSSFLVVGEAGIGKSRLVAEVLDRVEATSGKVLGMGCLPYYANVSLWPIAGTLERLLGLTGRDSDRLGTLISHLTSLGLDPVRFMPFLGALIGVTNVPDYPAPELDPTAFLDETLNCIGEWVSALTARTPHLLVVEDLHWADPSTLALLGRLVDSRLTGILIIATTRDDSVVPWRDAVQVLQLGRLDEVAARKLVDNIAVGRELDANQCAKIVGLGDGIPLVIEEMTRSYLDTKRSEAMPLRLQELFTWRLKAPGVVLRVVQVAATVGPTFDADTVSAVTGDEGNVAEQLKILADNGIIEPSEQIPNAYRFRHALLRDAAYETQVLDVRRETHASVAETMAERGAEPALIATHLDLAGQPEGAVGLYIAAAQTEQGRGAHTEATKLLSRALELLEMLPESDDRDLNELTARMLRALSVSSMKGYAAPDVQVDHRWAEELTKRLGTRPEVLPSLIAIWAYWLTSGDLSTSRGLIDRLTDMVSQKTFSWFQPEVESCAGYQEFFEGHLEWAQEHFERGVAGHLARPADQVVSMFWPLPNDPIAVSQIALASISTLRGELERAAHWEREAFRRADEIGFPRGPFSRAFVRVYAAWNRRFLGDYNACHQLGSEVVAIGQEYGYVFWTTLGSAYVSKDPLGGVAHREFLQQTVDTLRLMGQEAFVAANLGYLAQLHAAVGDIQRAQDAVAEALDVVRKSGEDLHLPELLRQRAVYALAAGGDADEAVADLKGAERAAAEQGARVARLRAALELARLAESSRPKGWRIVLQQARSGLPASFTSAETAAADDLFAG